ncbi:MAG: hypothetical protein H6667_19730 [Ardenticatenaceae bacterium]|nr:hypothetical protein [Ardenticatenaceae bacterium]
MGEQEEPEIINIEDIMQEIRQQILAKQTTLAKQGGQFPVSGERFSPEFYEHLFQAALAYDQTQVKIHVTPHKTPIIGPIIQWVRYKLHELVLFYVNKSAVQQMLVNEHLLQAISIMSQELERETRKNE